MYCAGVRARPFAKITTVTTVIARHAVIVTRVRSIGWNVPVCHTAAPRVALIKLI